MITFERVEKLGNHKKAYALGLRSTADLVESGIFQWGSGWDEKCLVAMDGETCAGYMEYSKDEDDPYLVIRYLCVAPPYRKGGQIFILLLSEMKKICEELSIQKVRFDYHPNNPAMKDAARILKARVHIIRAEIDISGVSES